MTRLIQLLRDNAQQQHRVRAESSATGTNVYVEGVISADWGVSAADLRAAFTQADGKDVALHINSPGGDAFEGRAMQAVIAGYSGKVTAIVEGVAASAATLLVMAAAEAQIVQGSRLMIHNGWTLAIGDRNAMLEMHQLLASFDAELAAEYARHTGGDAAHMTALMDAETWFTADEAKDAGFVDSVIKAPDTSASKAARWNLSAYANAPKPADRPPPTDDEITARAANVSRVNRSRLAALLTRT